MSSLDSLDAEFWGDAPSPDEARELLGLPDPPTNDERLDETVAELAVSARSTLILLESMGRDYEAGLARSILALIDSLSVCLAVPADQLELVEPF